MTKFTRELDGRDDGKGLFIVGATRSEANSRRYILHCSFNMTI